MTVLENAVANLANALETLESRLEARFHDRSATSDDLDANHRHTRAARGHAAEAGRGLTKSIDALKALLDETDPKVPGPKVPDPKVKE